MHQIKQLMMLGQCLRLFKILLIFIALGFLYSCEKEKSVSSSSAAMNNCEVDSELLVDIDWVHTAGTLATLRFDSSGEYFENGNYDGDWELENDCDSIFVTRESNDFYYRILSLSMDTLRLGNPAFGIVTYSSE